MSEPASEPAGNMNTIDTLDKLPRRPGWISSWHAIKQMGASFLSEEVKIRRGDQLTNILLICAILAAASIFMFPGQTLKIAAMYDALVGLIILCYVGQRLGIINTFNMRQTLFATELLFGFTLVGFFIAINMAVIFILWK